jgi:hypothetical protein
MTPPNQTDFEEQTTAAAPWWLKPIYALGVPSAIALLLVWFLMTVVVGGQNKTQDAVESIRADQGKQLQLLTLICRNTAQTERERFQCDVAVTAPEVHR